MLFQISGWLFLTLSLAGTAYTLLASWLVGRLTRTPLREAKAFPAVTILKPLHGSEPALEESLEGFFKQDYPGPVQIVFGVDDACDPAIAVVERLKARHPGADTALVTGTARHGTNPKISNLVNMQSAIRHGVLVLSDSDIAVTPDYLRRIVAALEPGEVGAVTCLYTGWPAGGLAAQLSAMGINYQFLPNVVTGCATGLAEPCFGSTIALKQPVFEAIGGFAAFADFLADDYEIGRAVRRRGLKVAIPPFAVRHACAETGLGQWLGHELRWMRTIRTVDPAGHAGSIVTHAIPLGLLGACLAGFTVFSTLILAATLAARGVLKWRFDRLFGGSAGPYWLLPVRDVLSFGVFLVSLAGGAVNWQGAHMQVARDGALSNR